MKYKVLLPRFMMLLLTLSNVACVRVDAGSTLPTFGEQLLDLVETQEFQSLRRTLIRNMGR